MQNPQRPIFRLLQTIVATASVSTLVSCAQTQEHVLEMIQRGAQAINRTSNSPLATNDYTTDSTIFDKEWLVGDRPQFKEVGTLHYCQLFEGRTVKTSAGDPDVWLRVCGSQIEMAMTKDQLAQERQKEAQNVAAYNAKQEAEERERIVAAAEKKKIEERNISIYNEKKNVASTDIVAQVLNYSSGLPETGGADFWYPHDKKNCIYRKAIAARVNESDADRKFRQVISVAFGGGSEQVETLPEIKLNDLDPKSIKVAEYTHSITEPRTRWDYVLKRNILISETRNWVTQDVLHSGKEIFTTQNQDIDRIRRGWSLIYSKYCKGAAKAF